MKLLAVKTDQPMAELWLYENDAELAHLKWAAHLKLAESLHRQITKILNKSSITLNELDGIVCFQGPGSFTGLRIGLSIANALAFANHIPIVATAGLNWQKNGIEKLLAGHSDEIVRPAYQKSDKI